jgi:hypothetical protein
MAPFFGPILALILQFSATRAFSSTFQFSFPNIPLDLGIRHIHTPESFALSHRTSMPDFELMDVTPPWRCGNYAVISFKFRTLLGENDARMFSDEKTTSYLIISTPNCPDSKVLTTLRVKREGTFGHKLHVSSMFLDPQRTNTHSPLDQIAGFGTSILTQQSVEDAIREGYAVKKEDPNLLIYRRMVLFGEDITSLD